MMSHIHTPLAHILIALIVSLAAIMPLSASAALISSIERFDNVTTNTTIYSTGTAIYTVNFTLHAFGDDVRLPIGVARGGEANKTVYVIENRGKEVTTSGHSLALLFSKDAEVEDGHYVIPKDSTRTFTLIAAWSDRATQTDPEGRLRVTEMPLTLGTDTKIVLNRYELDSLLTGYVSLDGNE